MTRHRSILCLAGALAVASAWPLRAHHAVTAEFDQNRPITFTGTIKVVEWMNPHIYTQVEAKDADGKTVVYRIEGAAPNTLFRQGWRKDSLKIGDVVTVKGLRAKLETSLNIGQATITTSDGRNVYGRGAGGGRAEPPAQ
jgi:hypothetical protein